METQISYSNLTIDTCFKNYYVVPDYQREYVWEHTEVEQLLSDLMEAYQAAPKKDYFLGTIVTYKANGSFELIDGQQRLTTFFILLCTLQKLYAANGESTQVLDSLIFSPIMNEDGDTTPSYHLKLQYEDASNILEIIHAGSTEPKKKSDSGERLFKAYRTISVYLAEHFPVFSDLKRFSFYLLNKSRFIQIETYDISDALRIFETINQRGKGLNSMDLLKNMIFRQVDRSCFNDLNRRWKEITDALERIGEKPLRFLRYFIMANYDVSSFRDGIIREEQIYRWLTQNDDQCHYTDRPFEFVELLKLNVDNYIEYLKPTDRGNGNIHLTNIPMLAGKSYRLHLLLLLSASNMDSLSFAKFKRIVESAVYYSVINKIPTNHTERTFTGWCSGLRHIHTEEEMWRYVKDAMLPIISMWKKTNMQNFMQLGLGSMQQYRVRFLLAKISAYVDALVLGQCEPCDISIYNTTGVDIEHIMPVTCPDRSMYGVSDEDFDTQVHRLGNLTLLEASINKSIHNSTYSAKCSAYTHSKFYLTRSISSLAAIGINNAITRTNQRLKAWAVWNAASIEERQYMLYELSEEIWGLHVD